MLKNTLDTLEGERYQQNKSACYKIGCQCLHPALTKRKREKGKRKKIQAPALYIQ